MALWQTYTTFILRCVVTIGEGSCRLGIISINLMNDFINF